MSGASMVIYLPVIHRGSPYLPLIREPFFNPSAVWYGFCDALAARSSANPGGANGPSRSGSGLSFCWRGVIVAVAHAVDTRTSNAESGEAAVAGVAPGRSDLALFLRYQHAFGIAVFVFF